MDDGPHHRTAAGSAGRCTARRRLWAGYAFAVDFREERGHAFMLDDQTFTERQQAAKQPGTCLHCHASVYPAYKAAGGGDLFAGFEKLNAMPYAEARALVEHPVACIDCHEPATMALRVTRPAFMEGIAALKKFQGVADYDVNRDATTSRCARSCAASATTSTTSRARRSG